MGRGSGGGGEGRPAEQIIPWCNQNSKLLAVMGQGGRVEVDSTLCFILT